MSARAVPDIVDPALVGSLGERATRGKQGGHVTAFGPSSVTVASGGSVHKVVKEDRKKVQANTQRLRRG
jgi:hypothetical protein